jgi:isopentenyl diphosphate isomerase/L-lactate dehydrogenase-like FMN-dependent dehydrogenase
VWGLAAGGQAGVEHVLRCLLAEFDLTLSLSGYANVGEVSTDAITSSS